MPSTSPSEHGATLLPEGGLPDYDSPLALKALLEREGLAMSKRFGQNFLVNRTARERILAELGAGAGDLIWEIGPGIGAMTAMILEGGHQLRAFEIDHGFSRLLLRSFGGRANFRLIEGDFLDTFRAELGSGGMPTALFGNLPYSAAAAIIAALIESGTIPPRMVFTVQKEAALRMIATPGSKDYSAFSVLCSSACALRLAFDLGRSSFWPVPNVTSTVVVLKPRRQSLQAADRKGFSNFVRSAFASRRKTLRNNLKAAGRPEDAIDAALATLSIRPDVRAEALVPEELSALYDALKG